MIASFRLLRKKSVVRNYLKKENICSANRIFMFFGHARGQLGYRGVGLQCVKPPPPPPPPPKSLFRSNVMCSPHTNHLLLVSSLDDSSFWSLRPTSYPACPCNIIVFFWLHWLSLIVFFCSHLYWARFIFQTQK